MKIQIFENSIELGKAAAIQCAAIINEAIARQGKARIVLSTGMSQFDTIKALTETDIDWSKVEMFHLDEYIGLPESHPASFRKYLKENVKLDFDGIETSEGIIAKARDEASGLVDELMTRGNILTINGTGLKVSGTGDRRDSIGVFFVPETGERIKASFIALNCPRTLMVLVPNELTKGESYHLAVETQSSIKRGSTLLKKSRSIVSPFTLKAA